MRSGRDSHRCAHDVLKVRCKSVSGIWAVSFAEASGMVLASLGRAVKCPRCSARGEQDCADSQSRKAHPGKLWRRRGRRRDGRIVSVSGQNMRTLFQLTGDDARVPARRTACCAAEVYQFFSLRFLSVPSRMAASAIRHPFRSRSVPSASLAALCTKGSFS